MLDSLSLSLSHCCFLYKKFCFFIFISFIISSVLLVLLSCKTIMNGTVATEYHSELSAVYDKHDYFLHMKWQASTFIFEVCRVALAADKTEIVAGSCSPALIDKHKQPLVFRPDEMVATLSAEQEETLDKIMDYYQDNNLENITTDFLAASQNSLNAGADVGDFFFQASAVIAGFLGVVGALYYIMSGKGVGYVLGHTLEDISVLLALNGIYVGGSMVGTFISSGGVQAGSKLAYHNRRLMQTEPRASELKSELKVTSLPEFARFYSAFDKVVHGQSQYPEQVESVTDILELMVMYFSDHLPDKQVRGYCYPVLPGSSTKVRRAVTRVTDCIFFSQFNPIPKRTEIKVAF